MSAVHGNLRVGDLNHFQMYHEGALQMNSMVNSGWWLLSSTLSLDKLVVTLISEV